MVVLGKSAQRARTHRYYTVNESCLRERASLSRKRTGTVGMAPPATTEFFWASAEKDVPLALSIPQGLSMSLIVLCVSWMGGAVAECGPRGRAVCVCVAAIECDHHL